MVRYLFSQLAFNNIGNKGVKMLIKANLPMLEKLSLSTYYNMKHRIKLKMKEFSTWSKGTGKSYINSGYVILIL